MSPIFLYQKSERKEAERQIQAVLPGLLQSCNDSCSSWVRMLRLGNESPKNIELGPYDSLVSMLCFVLFQKVNMTFWKSYYQALLVRSECNFNRCHHFSDFSFINTPPSLLESKDIYSLYCGEVFWA